MFKQLYAILALCLFASLGFAQNNVSIRVLDQKQQPLPGANVTIDQSTKLTNPQGQVFFDNLADKSYTATVTFLGYKDAQVKFQATQSKEIRINLSLSTILVDDVLVSATRAKENSATTFKNLSKEELRKNNIGQDIPYLIDQTPGVVVSSDAGAGIGYTGMRIRGSDNQRINVTLNGIPLNDAESMGSFFVNLPDFASSVESIQIQRGIGTSTNGAGAFGASLNLQTDALEENPYAELNNSFGSYNSWKNTVKVGSGLINNKYAFNARLSRIASDGYMERAISDLKSFYVDGGLYTGKHILKATVFSGKEKTYQAWNGVPEPLIKGDRGLLEDYAGNALGIYAGPELDRLLQADRTYNQFTYDNQTDNYTQTHAHLHYTNYVNEKVSLNLAMHYTRGAGYYEEHRADEKFTNYGIPAVIIRDANNDIVSEIKETDLVRRRWLDNHFYGMTYALNIKPSAQWNLTFGGAANQYLGDHYGEVIWARYASDTELGDRYYFNDAKKSDVNLYAKVDYQTGNWLFNLDVQGRNVNYTAAGDDNKVKNFNFDDNLFFFNPKFGTTYTLNSNSNLYASYAYAGKEPVRKDYVENPKNEFPKPEYMQDIEAGYRFRNQSFNIGANLYAMFYKDQLVPTGTLNDTGGALRINIPKSHRIGVEFDGAWMINEQFTWSATAALSQNKIADFVEHVPVLNDDWEIIRENIIQHGNTDIAMSPSTVLSNNLTYQPIEALSFSVLSKYVSRMYLDNTSSEERSINPYFVHNFRALYAFKALGAKRVDLNLTVNNIFNKKYEASGYTWRQMFDSVGTIDHYNFYFPQATTNFMLGLNIRF